jgi:hypothetical protein
MRKPRYPLHNLPIPHIFCQTSPMRYLTVTLCLTIAVLLGSAGESFALPPCPNNSDISTWTDCYATLTYAGGGGYVGGYKDGKPHGQGTYIFGPNSKHKGDKYVGEFRNTKMNGQGTLISPDGSSYVGEWKNGCRHGQGTSIPYFKRVQGR